MKTLYPVIAEPPSEEGAVQAIITLLPDSAVVGAVGAVGGVGNVAPFPGRE